MSTPPVWAILAGAALTILTSWALGKTLLRKLRLKLLCFEEDLIAILCGAAALTLLVFLLASVHLARQWAFLVTSAIIVAIAYWRGALRPAGDKLPKLPGFWLILFLLPFAAYTVLYFFNALAPEASPLGSSVYLARVAHWWRDKGFSAPVESPAGLGMLFLFAFSIGKHSAAALTHFAFLAAAPCLMLCYGRRFGLAPGCVLGATLFYLSPISGVAGTSAYYDAAAACVLFGCFYVLQIWSQERNTRLLIPAALLAAFACLLLSGIQPAGFRLAPAKLPPLWSLNGQQGAGLFGPWLMLAPLALLAARSKHGRWLLLATALCAPLVLLDRTTRFLLPASIFLAPALGLAMQNSPGIAPLLIALHSFVSWPNAVATFAAADSWRITGIPVNVALRRTSQDEYLTKRLPGYALARTVEEMTSVPAHVLMLEIAPHAYSSLRLLSAQSDDGRRATQTLTAGCQSSVIPQIELRFRFSETPVQKLRVVRAGTSPAGWSVTEMRVFLGGQEVTRRRGWRVTGAPDTFDTPRAFDNSEVTAWPVWGTDEPGMYLEEDFDTALPLDAVMLVCPREASQAILRLEALGPNGQWKTLAQQFEVALHEPPPGLRRAAHDELKALGFGYMISPNDSDIGGDLYRNPASWGITCLRELEGSCVYRLD